ncbi:MAG: 4'-phosphopantetheinyl transferase superfamily protein [Chloroflexales bacterium]
MINWLTIERRDCPPAQHVLAPPELERYAGLRTEKRRGDWLLGRVAAKRLVQRHMGGLGLDLSPAAIMILSDRDGAPRVAPWGMAMAIPHIGAELEALQISISHTASRSLCAMISGTRPAIALGADIEQIAARGSSFAQAYDTPAELALLDATPAECYDTLSTAIWSAKEALLKVTRHGLRVDTRMVTCLPAQQVRDGWAPVAISTELTSASVVGWWRVRDGYVITIAAGGEGGAHPSPRPSFSDKDEQCRTISTGCGR